MTWVLTYESIATVVDCVRSNQSKLQQESWILPMPHPLLSTSFNVDWLKDCGHWKVVHAPVNDPTTPTVVQPAHHARGCEVGKDTCHCLRYWRNWKKCVGDKYVLNAFSIYLHTQTHIQYISCMEVLQVWRKRFPGHWKPCNTYKGYSSKGIDALAMGSQAMPVSATVLTGKVSWPWKRQSTPATRKRKVSWLLEARQ